MNVPAKPNKTARPLRNALYRSRIEICRILQMLAKDRCSISAEIGEGRLFVTHILFVNPQAGNMVIAYCANKALNSELLELPAMKFSANHRDAFIAFEVADPVETQVDAQPAIQFSLPDTLILYHRREFPRFRISAEASLRCIADASGYIPFESHITDISHDGFGGIIYEGNIQLEPGTVLRGCRIIIPNGKAIVADLEVRYIAAITLPDGTLANRAGFRFIQKPGEITELINFFIQDLDRK